MAKRTATKWQPRRAVRGFVAAAAVLIFVWILASATTNPATIIKFEPAPNRWSFGKARLRKQFVQRLNSVREGVAWFTGPVVIYRFNPVSEKIRTVPTATNRIEVNTNSTDQRISPFVSQ